MAWTEPQKPLFWGVPHVGENKLLDLQKWERSSKNLQIRCIRLKTNVKAFPTLVFTMIFYDFVIHCIYNHLSPGSSRAKSKLWQKLKFPSSFSNFHSEIVMKSTLSTVMLLKRPRIIEPSQMTHLFYEHSYITIQHTVHRHNICQIFSTGKVSKIWNFTRESAELQHFQSLNMEFSL